jgi:hypothetical protein
MRHLKHVFETLAKTHEKTLKIIVNIRNITDKTLASCVKTYTTSR